MTEVINTRLKTLWLLTGAAFARETYGSTRLPHPTNLEFQQIFYGTYFKDGLFLASEVLFGFPKHQTWRTPTGWRSVLSWNLQQFLRNWRQEIGKIFPWFTEQVQKAMSNLLSGVNKRTACEVGGRTDQLFKEQEICSSVRNFQRSECAHLTI